MQDLLLWLLFTKKALRFKTTLQSILMWDKIKPEPMLGGHSRGSTCMQSFLHPVTLPALFRESTGSSLLMLLPKEDLSQTVRTWELCDL